MKNILIIGAGVAGTDVAREIKLFSKLNMKVVGYIDDDKSKLNKLFEGSKVLGNSNDIQSIAKKLAVDEIIIAIPSAQGDYINKFVNIAIDLGVSYKIVPRVREIIEGRATLSSIRKVDVTDLVGRPVVKSDVDDLKKFFKGKSVLVTGAAGSIGFELSSQIAAYKPKKLILFDIWENGIFELKQKFNEMGFLRNIFYVVGNIQDLNRLEETFKLYKPNYVFHAAAYKHVPLMEENPIEALKNNIIGTYNVATLSDKYKAERFVMVSTDKAAYPKNIMGMTKLFAEKIVRSINNQTKFTPNGGTKFMTVRFGNVLDSNGSVVPLFRKQIANGGPVTVTDKKMTRYFMTIPEASGLILKSALLGNGGELFVLDMGKPMLILDLAKKMIRLSGLIPDRDIKIIYTGVRKGEKLSEKLFTTTEKLDVTKDSKIFMSTKGSSFENLDDILSKVNMLIDKILDKDVKIKLKKLLYEK
ncbi:MAG: nucleoside-diphosphate sugar epimerase/dehydratase [Patescibacteria group bacterium]